MSHDDNNEEWIRHLNQQPLNTNNNEIRLLRFLPCTGNSDMIALEVVRHEVPMESSSADHARPYYALSYVWGDPKETRSIVVDDISVQIRENLWHFLQSLRKQVIPLEPVPRKKRLVAIVRRRLPAIHTQNGLVDMHQAPEILLWADFLCINQQNITERNSQVAMMDSIFHHASAVIGWLGGSVAFQAACELKQGMKIPHYRYRRAPRPSTFRVRDLQRAIAVLGNDPYWTRLWIVQEIVLARRFWMLCQDVFLTWDDYNSLFAYLIEVTRRDTETWKRKGKWTTPFARKRYLEMHEYFWYIQSDRKCKNLNWLKEGVTQFSEISKISIGTTFAAFGSVSCTEARDRVYGLLGILPQALKTSLQVDYSKPLLQVYLEACITFTNTKDMDDFFQILRGLCSHRVPVASRSKDNRFDYNREVVATPSTSDLSFLSYTPDVVFIPSSVIPGKIVKVDTLALVLRRGNDFITRTPQDRASEEEGPLCFVYSLLTTRTRYSSYYDNSSHRHFSYSAAIVFTTFELKVGDLFYDVSDSLSTMSSIVTRPSPDSHDPSDLNVLGTCYTARYSGCHSVDEYNGEWAYQLSVPNPIKWMRKRILGGRQKIRLNTKLLTDLSPETDDLVVTMNAAAVMDHLENMMIGESEQRLLEVKVGNALASLIEPMNDPWSDETKAAEVSL